MTIKEELVKDVNSVPYAGAVNVISIGAFAFFPKRNCSGTEGIKIAKRNREILEIFQKSRKMTFTFDEPTYMQAQLMEKSFELTTEKNELIWFFTGGTVETSTIKKIYRYNKRFLIITQNSHYMASDLYLTPDILSKRKHIASELPDYYKKYIV